MFYHVLLVTDTPFPKKSIVRHVETSLVRSMFNCDER